MTEQPARAKKENLRKAVQWLSQQGAYSPALIQQAARRFDLSPLDEAFLIRQFLKRDQRR